MLRPDKCPDPNTMGLPIVYDTLLEFFRQGIGPLESGFLELRLVRLLGVVPGSPDDACHLGNFVYATGKTNGDYLLDGPGASRSRRPRGEEIVGGPYRNEEESASEALGHI